MSVTVDDQPLAIETMGLRTVGQVLSHLQRTNRLVINLLIDGRAPEASGLSAVRQSPLNGHTIYIETAEPREMALSVLHEVEDQLNGADHSREKAIELLQKNQLSAAMEKLSGCFHAWYAAHESVLKVGQLLRIDLDRIAINGTALPQVMARFAEQLRQIKAAIEHRDFVTLSDVLTYETTDASDNWRSALAIIRQVVGG